MSRGGTITTIAGTGKYGFSGDGGPATSARLYNPYGGGGGRAGERLHRRPSEQPRAQGLGRIVTDQQRDPQRGRTGRRTAIWLGVAVAAAAMAATGAFGVSSGGTITTVAGTGARGASGDGGRATSARLSFPQGVAVDDKGNVYIADSKNNRVRKVSTGGRITTFAGTGKRGSSGDGGRATSARLNDPQAVAVDAEGNVYIAEQLGQRVRKVTPGGIITTFAGTGDPTSSGDGGPASSASVFYPMGVAVDGRGGVYITGPHGIRKVSGGTITTIVPSTQKLAPRGLRSTGKATSMSPTGTTPYARSRPAGRSRRSRAAARRASVTAVRRHRRSSAASSALRWTSREPCTSATPVTTGCAGSVRVGRSRHSRARASRALLETAAARPRRG